jgi:hypothetical protein
MVRAIALVGLTAALLSAAPAPMADAAVGAGRFDGTWDVSLACDPHTVGVRPYTFHFSARVTGGVLHGEHGTEGMPAWLAIDGKIQPDGTALLAANGLTNNPDYSLQHVPVSTPYAYRIAARFEGTRGTGSRIENRDCAYTFVKR